MLHTVEDERLAYATLQKILKERSPTYRMSVLSAKLTPLMVDILSLGTYLKFKCPAPEFTTSTKGTFEEALLLAYTGDLIGFSSMRLDLQFLVHCASDLKHIGVYDRMVYAKTTLTPTLSLLARYNLPVKPVTFTCKMCGNPVEDGVAVCEACITRLDKTIAYREADFTVNGYALADFAVKVRHYDVKYSLDKRLYSFTSCIPDQLSYPELPFVEYQDNLSIL